MSDEDLLITNNLNNSVEKLLSKIFKLKYSQIWFKFFI